MTTSSGEGSALFSRAIRETLDTVVAPRVRDALIHDALSLGGLSSLPTSRAAMRAFAAGPLRKVAERALGAELAHSVADEILRVVPPSPTQRNHPPGKASRSSHPPMRRSATPPPATRRTLMGPGTSPWRKSPEPGTFKSVPPPLSQQPGALASTPPPGTLDAPRVVPHASEHRLRQPLLPETLTVPPSSGEVPTRARQASSETRPHVLAVTADDELLATLTEWFTDRATVSPASDPIALVRLLDTAGDARVVVILDGKAPSIRPGALAVLLEAAPHVEVVLCRAAPATEHVVLSASPTTAKWIVYREPASLDHVAAECLRLVS